MESLKKKLFYIVKYSPIVYYLYYTIGSACIYLLKLFVKTDDKLILFSSFGGRKFDDSPKVIYEQMLRDKRFKEYKLVWAFVNPENIDLPIQMKVKCDTLQYYITALKARVWITNSSIERGLSFKGRDTFYFNTWHGTALKKMGLDVDIELKNTSFTSKGEMTFDVFLCQSEYDANVFIRAFRLSRDIIHTIGLPRNDIFAYYTPEYQLSLKAKLNIPADKKVILYAPTFREYEKTKSLECKLEVPVNLEYWKERLGKDYVLLFRAHYEVAKSMEIKDDDFVRDMSAYPQLEDLMIVSDMLISDYSSIFFDYSIMHKPMYCFAYDYERYASERGMYFDIRECLPTANNENDLLGLILTANTTDVRKFVEVFQKEYVTEFGKAGLCSVNIIAENLKLNT